MYIYIYSLPIVFHERENVVEFLYKIIFFIPGRLRNEEGDGPFLDGKFPSGACRELKSTFASLSSFTHIMRKQC